MREVGDRGGGSSEFHESFTAERKWEFEGKLRRKLRGILKARKQKPSQSYQCTFECCRVILERLREEKELLTRTNERRAKEKRIRDVEPGRAERSVMLVMSSLQRGTERLERCVERQEAISRKSRFLSLSLFTLSFKFDPVSLTGTAAIYSLLQRPLKVDQEGGAIRPLLLTLSSSSIGQLPSRQL